MIVSSQVSGRAWSVNPLGMDPLGYSNDGSSSKPFHFGYTFSTEEHPGLDEPAPAPVAPAAGNPLLDFNENYNMDQFFGNFDDNNSGFLNEKELEKQFALWPADPPPQFLSASSSLGRPDFHSAPLLHTNDFLDFGQHVASTAKFSTGSRHPTQRGGDPAIFGLDLVEDGMHSNPAEQYHPSRVPSSTRHPDAYSGNFYNKSNGLGGRTVYTRQSAPTLTNEHYNSADRSFLDSHPNKNGVSFDEIDTLITTQQAQSSPDLKFGTDTSFLNHRFAPPPGSEQPDEIERRVVSSIHDGLILQTSAGNTQPSSPVLQKRQAPERNSISTTINDAKTRLGDRSPNPPSAKKRRKVREDDDTEINGFDLSTSPPLSASQDTATRFNGKRDSSKAKPPAKRRSTANTHGRRRSNSSERMKAARQNLTEEEKKDNHVKSEQKRRNLIAQGYHDLQQLVPEPPGAAPSKCGFLTNAADWLDRLVEGNKRLRAQLESMRP